MRQTHTALLEKHLPVEAVEPFSSLLKEYQVSVRISRERHSKLGDFRPGNGIVPHLMSVNGNLNPYEFLLVALHELAHADVYRNYGRRVAPHGNEWKIRYGALIREAVDRAMFHPSLHSLLNEYSYRVKAGGIADSALVRALKIFGESQDHQAWLFLEDVPDAGIFRTRKGRRFVRGEKVRTRVRCLCLQTKRQYLVHSMTKVRMEEVH